MPVAVSIVLVFSLVQADSVADSLGHQMLQGDESWFPDLSDSLQADEENKSETLIEQLNSSSTDQEIEFGEMEMAELFADELPPPRVVLRTRLMRKLQPGRGYLEGKYVGNSSKLLQRVSVTHGERFGGNVVIEKDAGEPRVADFLAGGLFLKDAGVVHRFVIGDYFIESGQGLAHWRSYAVGKGGNSLAPLLRRSVGIKALASPDEVGYLRGLAADIRIGNFFVTGYFSQKSLSASVDTSSRVTSFYESGYYRTESEQKKRNALTEQLIGGGARWVVENQLKLGLKISATRFSREVALSSGLFAGRSYRMIALDWAVRSQTIVFAGEAAVSGDNPAVVASILVDPVKQIRFGMGGRSYSRGFFSRYGNGFRERSKMAGERGLYFAVEARPARGLQLSGYFDQYWAPGGTSSSRFDLNGNEYLFEVHASPTRALRVSVRYRARDGVDGATIDDRYNREHRIDETVRKRNLRLSTEYRLSASTTLRSRAEFVFREEMERSVRQDGVAVIQDLSTQILPIVRLDCRMVVFRTDSYDSGIAAFERDLSGVVSIPTLYGQGVKWYLLITIKPFRDLTISAKYSELIRDDVEYIGSGLDEIGTNRDNRLGVQVDFVW